MSDIKTFWSPNINPTSSSELKNILRKQAIDLGRLTKNIVEAEINTKLEFDNAEGFSNEPNYLHSFDIVAPLLGFKNFTLFTVRQPLITDFPSQFYSAYWDKKDWVICRTISEFNQGLEEILASEKTVKLINSIIAQSA